jgi:hypothetical protein
MREALLDADVGPMEEAELDRIAEEILTAEREELGRRIAAVFDRYKSDFEYVDDLPAGDLDAAMEEEAGAEKPAAAPEPQTRARAPGQSRGWATVTSIDELQRELEVAAADAEPVLIHYHASWALPAIHIEQHVLSTGEAEQALAGYRCVFVEMTEPSAATNALTKALQSNSLPTLYVFRDPAALSEYLAGEGEWPEPAAEAFTAAQAETLVETLVREADGGDR